MIDVFDNAALDELQRNLLREEELSVQMASAIEPAPQEDGAALHDSLLAMAQGARTLALRIGQMLEDERPLKIAVVGDYSAGKSSFINHLLGDDTLCPVRDDPTTSHVTVFGYSPVERIARRTDGGRTTRLTREQYVEQVQSSSGRRSSGKPRRFIIGAPIPALQGIELLDTPGFNNLQNAGDTEATESVLGEVDAVLFLVDANTGTIPESGVQRLRKLRALLPGAPVRVMFTKADAKAPGRMRALVDDCQQRHGQVFDGHVLAYSTREAGERTDIISREAMADTFRQMAASQREAEARSLTHAVRQHLHQREHMLSRCTSQLGILIEMQSARAGKALKNKELIRQRFDRLRSDMGSVYQSEVRDTLRASFRVEEISGTGWFFKDARIVRVTAGLAIALASFKSVREIRERMRSEIKRYVTEDQDTALSAVDQTCSEATAETTARAKELVEASFGHLFGRSYDYDTAAREKLQGALGEHSSVIAEALWEDWSGWIHGLYEILDDHYLTVIVDDAQNLTSTLQGCLDTYRDLVEHATPTMQEIA